MKEFILDLYITLNNNDTEINLEMQINNLFNWPERSLSYLCRTYDNLCRGQDYHLTKPAIHIEILDFTLFPDTPEFYATYKLMNVRNHHIFNDKFILSAMNVRCRNDFPNKKQHLLKKNCESKRLKHYSRFKN